MAEVKEAVGPAEASATAVVAEGAGAAPSAPATGRRLLSLLDPRAWSYAMPGSRDLRLDLLRGFLVVAMVVDHLGGDSLFTALSGYNRFVVSAAEGFIFISGMLMGIVYGRRMQRAGLAAGIIAVLQRARFLYFTVTGLTVAFILLFLVPGFPIWFDRSSGLGVESPAEALVGALTLHYSYNGTDVLAIYVLLIAAAPLVFYLLYKGWTWQVLGGSWLLWGLYQAFPAQAEIWSVRNSWFPFAAWQALFYTGVVIGYQRERVQQFTRRLSYWPVFPLLLVAMGGLLVLSRAYHGGTLAELGVPGLSNDVYEKLFAKPTLGPGRVAAFFVLAVLAQQVVTRFWKPLDWALGWFLLPLGQSALLAYSAHLVLLGPVSALFAGALWGDGANVVTRTLAQAALVGVVLALATRDTLLRYWDPCTAACTGGFCASLPARLIWRSRPAPR